MSKLSTLEQIMKFLSRGGADVDPIESKVVEAMESGATLPGFRAVRDVEKPFSYPVRSNTLGWHLDPSPSGSQARRYLTTRQAAYPKVWTSQSGVVPVMYNLRGAIKAGSDRQANVLEELLSRYGLMDDYRDMYIKSDEIIPPEEYLSSKEIYSIVYPNDVEGVGASARLAEKYVDKPFGYDIVVNPSISILNPQHLKKVSKKCGGLVGYKEANYGQSKTPR